MKTIIIGGVAGGATCAARLRRLDEYMKITMYEKSGYISYANCGLPYYIGGVIEDKMELTLQTPQSFKARFNVDVKVNCEVIKIDPKNKEVIIKDLINNKEFKDNYDKLVIATGANAIIPNISGKEYGFVIKNVEDTFLIDNYIKENKVKKAVVVGGGFIGLEMVENLVHKGIAVTLVERASQVLLPIDYEMASFIHNELRVNKVNLKLNKELVSINKENGVFKVNLADEEIDSDLVVFALGVRPNSSLASDIGLNLGIKNSIKVNKYLETSIKDIYACGDVVEIKNHLTNEDSLFSLAGPANKQARIVADNICGLKREYKGALGTSIIKCFNYDVAFVGLNERSIKEKNIKYNKIYLSPNNHASYYPNSSPLNIKILFSLPEYKILGAQIIGSNGVDKRIDILSLAIYNNIPLVMLKDVDFAYAPPYSSAKDPINMAAFIADNLVLGKLKQFYIEDIKSLLILNDGFFLDVRTKKEYEAGHIEGFINFPLDELRQNVPNIPKNKKIYVMCQSALRSYIACKILSNLGYDCYNLAGGYRLFASVYLDAVQNKQVLPCGIERSNK